MTRSGLKPDVIDPLSLEWRGVLSQWAIGRREHRQEVHSVSVAEGSLLWEPSNDRRSRANLTGFVDWLATTHGELFKNYQEL